MAESGVGPIRSFESHADFEACVRLQEEVWGAGFSERVPTAILKAARRLGGVVAGAWDEEGLAGFVFGITGPEGDRLAHWSDMLAVRPGLRGRGLGRRLKAYQRDVLLARGVKTVYWTFDPLESRNAWLNLGRLGAVAREYVRDMYGATDSPLHHGIGTDRFVAVWRLDTPRVEARLRGRERPPPLDELSGLPRAFEVEVRDGLPRPVGDVDGRRGAGSGEGMRESASGGSRGRLLVPIPARIHELKEAEPALAARWREVTRGVLGPMLGRGWEARELVRGDDAVSWYLLDAAGGGDR